MYYLSIYYNLFDIFTRYFINLKSYPRPYACVYFILEFELQPQGLISTEGIFHLIEITFKITSVCRRQVPVTYTNKLDE